MRIEYHKMDKTLFVIDEKRKYEDIVEGCYKKAEYIQINGRKFKIENDSNNQLKRIADALEKVLNKPKLFMPSNKFMEKNDG